MTCAQGWSRPSRGRCASPTFCAPCRRATPLTSWRQDPDGCSAAWRERRWMASRPRRPWRPLVRSGLGNRVVSEGHGSSAVTDDGAPAESAAVPGARAVVRDAAAPDPLAAAKATRPSWGGRLPRAAALASVAMAVPDNVVSNATVAEGAGVTEQWIVHRTGVRERRHVSQGERLSDLAVAAGRAALDDAGIRPDEVDMVLVACLAPDELTPNAAPLVAHELGAHGAGAMDVGAACTGYLSALSLATAQIECGRCENVLVIGADVMSRFVDKADRGTAALFADGAGATLVTAANGGAGRVGPITLQGRRARRARHLGQPRRADHPHAGPRHLQGRRPPALRVDAGRRGARRPGARRHRPLRLPPGQRQDPRGGGREARSRDRARDRLHRPLRQHLFRHAADRPGRRAASAGCSSRA